MIPLRERPIGIFDSGLGGLTVVRKVHEALPREDLIYLGDTARVPYGTKSPGTVIRFAREDTRFLVQQKVKAVVVACNTASAWALSALEAEFPVPVFGVILPGARAALARTRNGRIGVIGTTATVRSQAYDQAILSQDNSLRIFSRACPLLVPLVEEGRTDDRVVRLVLEEYLRPLLRRGVDTLVLGCTHYPLLKRAIQRVAGRPVHLVDSAERCAEYVRERLAESGLLADRRRRRGAIQPFVTDEVERFADSAERFLGQRTGRVWQVELGG